MSVHESKINFMFRALGEAAAIVLAVCGTYMGLLLIYSDPEAQADGVGALACGGPVVGLTWFVVRVVYRNSRASNRFDGGQRWPQAIRRDGVAERAALKRIAVPSVKRKKRKNDADSDDAIYRILGRGTQATDPVDLDSGMYRLAYQFTPGIPMTIKLIQLLSGEEDILLDNASGTGSQTFMVEQTDRYIFQVTMPGAQVPAWKIEVERL